MPMPTTSRVATVQNATEDPIDVLLTAHGLRRTQASRKVLGWLLAHPEISYTHAQLQAALQSQDSSDSGPNDALSFAAAQDHAADQVTDHSSERVIDRVTLYRLVDRLTLAGLLLCRVDAQRVRRYQAMPASVHAAPHFECQSCHQDSPLADALRGNAQDLERAAQTALDTLKALGYQGLHTDFAVRGVCATCASA